jgi:hypothetical protein
MQLVRKTIQRLGRELYRVFFLKLARPNRRRDEGIDFGLGIVEVE